MAQIFEHLESKIKEWQAMPQTPEIQALIQTYTKLLKDVKKSQQTREIRETRTMIKNL